MGLIFQALKLKPPAQCQRFCGFIYDTVGLPEVQIPEDKLSRALALVRYAKYE
jgi:hypothetical protein